MKEKIYNYVELLKIKKLSREQMDNGEGTDNFNERWKLSWATNKPVRDWCEDIATRTFKANGLETIDKLHSYVLDQDQRCSEIPEKEFGLIRNDDEFTVRVCLDYDYDTTMAKFWVRHLQSGLTERSAINLGTKYLQHAAVTIHLKP